MSSRPGGDPLCPRCGGRSSRAFDTTDRNRRALPGPFRYQRCDACGVMWLLDVPEDLSAAYPADYHAFSTGEQLEVDLARERVRLELVRRHVTAGRLVEIGPSQGAFARVARDAGFDVVGLEMDPDCVRHLTDVVGVQAIRTQDPAHTLRTMPPSRVIVLWHVIEHLPDVWSAVDGIAANLEPGGVLAVATPNPQSLGARLLRGRWVHVDAPRHLTLIPLDALSASLSQLGLRLLTATTLDPFGVILTRMSWERSLLRPPTLRYNPRLAYTRGVLLGTAFGPIERRGLHGAAYTAVYRKQA